MSVVSVVAGLCALDVSCADQAAVERALTQSAGVRRWLDGVDVALAARLVKLAETSPSLFPEQTAATATRTGVRDGTKLVGRATTVAAVPELGAVLGTGEVSGAHIDAVTAALAGLEPAQRAVLAACGAELAVLAAGSTPDQFRRTVTSRGPPDRSR